MKKLWTCATTVLKTVDESATVQVAKKGVDIASTAVNTGTRVVFWLQAATVSSILMGLLLIADICVHIIK